MPASLNFEVQFQLYRKTVVTGINVGIELFVSSYPNFSDDWSFQFVDSSTPYWDFAHNGVQIGNQNTANIPASGVTWLIKVVVSSLAGTTTLTAYYSTNLTTPVWSQLCTASATTPANPVNTGLRTIGPSIGTASTGARIGALLVQDITPATATLTGPTVGITGAPQEFLVSLNGLISGSNAVAPAGGDVITLSSGNGLDTFSATPGGASISTITIPAGSSQVAFYLMPAGSSARNISITDGNGYSVAGSPISFTPSASLSDPTVFSWVNGGMFRPMSLMDPNQILFNQTNFSSVTPAGTYTMYGTGNATVALNSSGVTITSTSAGQLTLLALPLSCYPSVGMACIELTFGSENVNGGTIQWGPALIRTDSNYPGSSSAFAIISSGGIDVVNRVNSTTASITVTATTGISATASNFNTAGVATTGAFTQNVATLFYRPIGGLDTYVGTGLSSSTINSTATGTELASIVTGACDQRDTTIAPYLTLGIYFYASASGASLNITKIRTGTYYGGQTLCHIPVLRTSTGAPYTDSNGNILVLCENQGPSIDGNHNYQAWEATHWYYPATDTLSAPLTYLATVRNAAYTTSNPSGATRLCIDSDGCLLYEDRPGNANYGSWHVYQVTTGTDFQFEGSSATENNYSMIYNLTSSNLTTAGQIVVLSSPTTVSLPGSVGGGIYDLRVVCINNTWYCAGMSSTNYNQDPTYLFIASGSTPTTLTTVVLANLAVDSGQTAWDGVGIVRYKGVWYATGVQGKPSTSVLTKCFNLTTGALVGTMASPLTQLTSSPFLPHCLLIPYQFVGSDGKRYTQYRRLSHNGDFTAWGQDWSFGGTKYNTWMFGDLVTNRSPILPGWEFAPSSAAASILCCGF